MGDARRPKGRTADEVTLKRTRFGHRQQPAPPVYPCKEPAQYPIDNDMSGSEAQLIQIDVCQHPRLQVIQPRQLFQMPKSLSIHTSSSQHLSLLPRTGSRHMSY
ncbi:hypothetical protein LshimejAT787_3700110 [Lyophyllum shimeji]|uniref:Uncharacterized protein n=1 Tax=Lyophyllum shimeji TaxID=47721 RepID=A0A9P3UUR9_LYOSH|nr:hypothetical protein LshimejAT787_3700110 [Lyophyllum shimeji]